MAEILYRKAPGMIFDCLQMASMKLNDPADWLPILIDIEKEKEDIHFFHYWTDQFDNLPNELLVFFYKKNRSKPGYITTVFSRIMKEKGGAIQFLDLLNYIDQTVVSKMDLISYYLPNFAANTEDAEEAIRNDSSLSGDMKFYLLGFIVNTEKYCTTLKTHLRNLYQQIENLYTEKATEILHWAETIDTDCLQELYEAYYPNEKKKGGLLEGQIIISISILQKNTVYFGITEPPKWYIIGYDFKESLRFDRAYNLNLTEFANALGDPYRKTAIDCILEQGEVTSSDLAKRLGVALNTVAYHLDILKKAGLIIPHTRKKTIYYILNSKPFYAASYALRIIAEGRPSTAVSAQPLTDAFRPSPSPTDKLQI